MPHGTASLAPTMTCAAGEQMILEEAAALDEGRWDDWLALFSEDCVFWAPSWDDYSTPTADPESQLSLIYYSSRKRLEERIWRLRSGQSPASVPLHRTMHGITGFRLDKAAPDTVLSNFTVHSYNPRRKETFVAFGRYRHQFVTVDGALKISAKTILLLNDYLPASVDIYTI